MRLPKKTKCEICGLELTNYNYTPHFRKHNLTKEDYFKKYGKFWYLTNQKKYITISGNKVKKSSLRSGISALKANNNFTLSNLKFLILVRSYHNVIKFREFSDFVSGRIFPEFNYRQKFEQYKKIIEYSEEKSETLEYLTIRYGEVRATKVLKEKSDRVRGDKNPAYNHGGRLSPFSKKFVKYENKSDEEITEIVNEYNRNRSELFKDEPERLPINKEYWIERGYSEEESKELQIGRKSSFSLESCIEKLGEKAGYIRWKERQDKWMTTMNSKSPEEIKKINKRKIYKSELSSKTENKLYKKLKESIGNLEQQLMIETEDSYYLYDIFLSNKIIEFNGDYWHANPNKYKKDDKFFRGFIAEDIWKRDKIKIEHSIKHNYDVLVIWESEYKNNESETIEKCLKHLTTNS